MADGFSITFADALLGVLSGTAPTTYSTVYIGLHTGDPGTAGTSNVSAGSATRESVSFGTPASGAIATSATVSWTNAGTSETITDLSVWSAASSGTFITSMPALAPQAWVSGNVVELTSMSITFPTAS